MLNSQHDQIFAEKPVVQNLHQVYLFIITSLLSSLSKPSLYCITLYVSPYSHYIIHFFAIKASNMILNKNTYICKLYVYFVKTTTTTTKKKKNYSILFIYFNKDFLKRLNKLIHNIYIYNLIIILSARFYWVKKGLKRKLAKINKLINKPIISCVRLYRVKGD